MGDAVMAFWNAPLDDTAHERNACHAAIDMLDRVAALNEVREQEAATNGHRFVPIKMGIGINTGQCAVGNMGSDLRFQYTVMGDSVNLASRLEGQTKAYGLSIIIGAATAATVAPDFALLEVDSIRVKGKTEPEIIHTIVGRADAAQTAEFKSLQDHWSKFLASYRKQDWSGALKTIESCRCDCEKFDLVGLLEAYADRIGWLQKNPPNPEWDGVFVAETK
jgi:adenylate cyclase